MIASIPQIYESSYWNFISFKKKVKGVILLNAAFGALALKGGTLICTVMIRAGTSHVAPSLTIWQWLKKLFIPIKVFLLESLTMCIDNFQVLCMIHFPANFIVSNTLEVLS